MSKSLVGHHLMRVRIRKNIFELLQDVAEEQTMQTGEHVTVSDLVRAACVNYLVSYEGLRQLQNAMDVLSGHADAMPTRTSPIDTDTDIFIVNAPVPLPVR